MNYNKEEAEIEINKILHEIFKTSLYFDNFKNHYFTLEEIVKEDIFRCYNMYCEILENYKLSNNLINSLYDYWPWPVIISYYKYLDEEFIINYWDKLINFPNILYNRDIDFTLSKKFILLYSYSISRTC